MIKVSNYIIRVYGDRDKGIRPHHQCNKCALLWEANYSHPKSNCSESNKIGKEDNSNATK